LKSTHPIVEDTLKSRDCIFISDIRSSLKYNSEHAKILNIREIISAPIYDDNNPVGVIQIFNSIRRKKHLKEEDIELLKLFIPHTEIAIKIAGYIIKLKKIEIYIKCNQNIPNPLVVLDKINNSRYKRYIKNILILRTTIYYIKTFLRFLLNNTQKRSRMQFGKQPSLVLQHVNIYIKKNDTEIPAILNFSTVKTRMVNL